jgi:hypothetical protein
MREAPRIHAIGEITLTREEKSLATEEKYLPTEEKYLNWPRFTLSN